MRLTRSAVIVLALAGAAGAQAARPSGEAGPFGFERLGNSKEPITVVADSLEYDYRGNVIRYRGHVEVTQGNITLVSDTLTITLEDRKRKAKAGEPAPDAPQPPPARPMTDTGRVREIVAAGNVRIDQGARWAVGGRAVFDQTQRTLILTEQPVLHDGPNQVAGDRVVVYLDEDRSVVEGGQQRVKAILHPDQQTPRPKPGGAKRAGSATPGATAAREPR